MQPLYNIFDVPLIPPMPHIAKFNIMHGWPRFSISKEIADLTLCASGAKKVSLMALSHSILSDHHTNIQYKRKHKQIIVPPFVVDQ